MNAWTQIYLVVATIAQTAILLWGLRKVSEVLNMPVAPPANGLPVTTFAQSMLSEKTPPAQPANQQAANVPIESDASFSRVAGSIGTVVLAAFIGGVSYWALFGLFSGADLTRLSQIGTFVLTGSALFAPYAVNQLRAIFK